jgi:hypothetical protein
MASSARAKVIWLHIPLQFASNDHEDEDCNSMSIVVPFAVITAVSPIFNSSRRRHQRKRVLRLYF